MPNSLQDPPDKIIRQLLVDLGVVSKPVSQPPKGSWPAYYAKEPPQPDDCVTVRITDAPNSARAMATGELLGPLGIQIRVRSADADAGWLKADEIQTAGAEVLDSVVAIGDRRYLVHALCQWSNVIPLGTIPGSQRSVHTTNCITNIRQLS